MLYFHEEILALPAHMLLLLILTLHSVMYSCAHWPLQTGNTDLEMVTVSPRTFYVRRQASTEDLYNTGLPLRRLCKDWALLKWLPRDPDTLGIALLLLLGRPEMFLGPTSETDEHWLRLPALRDRNWWFAL